MKIYFTASIRGKDLYADNYREIVGTLIDMGYNLISDHIINTNEEQLDNETAQQRIDHNKKLHRWISSCDCVVAEVSHPSISVGYELTLALEANKPILALHIPAKIPSALLGEPSEKFIMSEYVPDKLKELLPSLIKNLTEKQDIRFNFFITPQLISYMDWLSEKKRIPRSVYLRGLIDKEMRSNKEYQKEISGEGDK